MYAILREDHINGIMGAGIPRCAGDKFVIVKDYFYNGEGWFTLKTADGYIFESPDVFWKVDG